MLNYINKILLFVLIIAVCSGLTYGHEGHHHEDLRHWEIASPDPDRIFLTFYGDATTSRAVTWRTDASITKAVVEIARSTANPNFSAFAKQIQAKTETVDLNKFKDNVQGKVNYHSAILDELEPDTLYAYRVGDGGKYWSEWIQFKTAKEGYAPFSFVYFGDAQNGILSHWSRVIRMANQKAPEAAFAIHAGDLVNDAHHDVEWAEWFKAGSFLHGQWTGIPVLGNHEYKKLGFRKAVSLLWRPQFTIPLEPDLPDKLQETVYTIDYQDMRVIVLNSIFETKDQTKYLEKKLKESNAKWKVLTCHYSIFSPAKGRDFSYGRKRWKPLLDKYKVDLVLQGHDHTYARGHVPVRTDDKKYDDGFQTMYVTSVSGQKMYDISDDQLEKYGKEGYRKDSTAMDKQFFQVIDVDGKTLTYKAYTADGQLYDEVTITKDFQTGKKTIK